MLGVREVRVVLGGEVAHRRLAHVLEQRRIGALEVGGEEHALAQACLGDLHAFEAAGLHHRLHDQRAGQDQVAALGLDARHLGALGRREVGEPVHQLVQRVPAQREALHAERRQLGRQLGRRRQVSHGAADARELAAVLQPRDVAERVRHVRPQRLEVLGLDLLLGQEALGHAHGADRPRPHVERLAALHARQLHRAAAEVERDAVGQRGRVDRREIAVVGLLLGREDLHVERRPAQELVAVGGVADRRRGDRPHVVDPGRAAEVRVQVGRLDRSLHRLGRQHPCGVEALADPHRLMDLVGALEPLGVGGSVFNPGEDDQAERVRPEVDDRQPPFTHDFSISSTR